MQYTLKDLFDSLEITMTELKRRSGISDVTLISIRNGKSARRSTINTLLRTFSEIYGVNLTLKNVSGIIIQGKPVDIPAEKVEKPPVSALVVQNTAPVEKAQKREYTARKTGVPPGGLLATDFAKAHTVKRETFRDHMLIGLGPGLPPGTEPHPVIGFKDHVEYSEHVKRKRRNKDGNEIEEKERYLTQEQQHQAIKFWHRHGVAFDACNRFECWCHTYKNGKQ